MSVATYDVRVAPLEGTTLVEASAGTGKTFTITTLVLRLVLERRLDVREILVMTYTRAATAELRDRIRARLADALAAIDDPSAAPDVVLREILETRRASADVDRFRLRVALRALDDASVFTIHGYCQRALVDHALMTGASFDTELLADEDALIAEVSADFWSGRFRDVDVSFLEDAALDLSEVEWIVRRAAEKPRIPFIPTMVGDDPYAALTTLVDRARREWPDARDAIRGIFSRAGINRSKIKSEKTDEYFEAVDRALTPRASAKTIGAAFAVVRSGRVQFNKGYSQASHPFLDLGEKVHEEATKTGESVQRRVRVEAVQYGRREVEARKRKRGVRGYEDLLLDLRDALVGPHEKALAERLADRWKAALVDEFQDTDEVQYTILRNIYGGRASPVVFVGDPKQAIYSFRGADLRTYLDAATTSGAKRFALGTSFRADPGLVAAISAIYGAHPRPFDEGEIAHPPLDAACATRLESDDGDAPFTVLLDPEAPKSRISAAMDDRIATEVVRLLEWNARIAGEPIRPEDVAVLCRTNDQARGVQRALRRRGVPAVFDGDHSVLRGEPARALEHLLAAMDDPRDLRKVRNALATPLFGASAHDLLSIDDQHADDAIDWVGHFSTWHEQLETNGVVSAIRGALESPVRGGVAMQAALLRRFDGERWMTDLLHLVEILHDVEHRERLRGDALVQWYRRARGDDDDRLAPEASQLRIESDRRALRLTTVHRSKGLEYPIVFVAFMDSEPYPVRSPFRFHDETAGGALTLCVGPRKKGKGDKTALPAEEQAAYDTAVREQRLEELRVLYVALTRAKHRTYAVLREPGNGTLRSLPYLLLGAVAPNRLDLTQWDGSRPAAEILGGLVDLAGGHVRIRPIAEADHERRYRGFEDDASVPLVARTLDRRIDGSFRSSSFSRLVHDAHLLAPLEAEGVDRDESAERERADRGPVAGPALAGLPRGTRTGLLVHEALERIDFAEAPENRRPTLVRCLERHRFPVDAHLASLDATITDVLATPLGPPTFTLGALLPTQRLDELEFLFPVSRADGGRLTTKRLAEVLRAHGSPVVVEYAKRAEQLGFPPIAGFLQGFVDLVAEHDGRFYVIDYKTNDLGPHLGDYAEAPLDDAMVHHDYVLQALIYSIATHRYLGQRVRGYDYDRDFGGIRYLFVRGMRPSYALGTGVFEDRPSRALVEALDALLRSPDAA